MADDLLITTFPAQSEFQKTMVGLDALGARYRLIVPSPALSLVALPGLVVAREVRAALEADVSPGLFSGWVDYRPASAEMPGGPEPEECGVCLRRAAVMVLSPCVADETKIRIIAHLKGDMGPVLPYLNAVIPQASYTPAAETLTFMDGYRMIALYRHRITIAKADELVDAWLALERIRRLAEETWENRARIEPCFETRKRPPAIEIYKRLPGTNCGRCGERTCLAFAVKVWSGEVSAGGCLPVFSKDSTFPHLKEPLLEICAGMGIAADALPGGRIVAEK